ncbi:hypothetical protein ACFXGR_23020 [Streptomyces mirabilis]|uniref:hypothetical protein n=1 Tax=Streptomyces mirabilis TaxID=68239 RepID=UPI0036ADD2C2
MDDAASSPPQKDPTMDSEFTAWRNISDVFLNQMFSLLSINELLIPQIMQNSDGGSERMKKFGELLTPDELDELGEAIEWAASSMKKLLEGKSTKGQSSSGNQRFTVNNANVTAALIHLVSEAATSAFTDDDTLRKSLLVTAVSNFEILYGNMAQRIYHVNKSALNDSDYSFSLQELAEFESLDEARQFLIERRVSALMRESVDGWDKWLSRAVKGVSMGSLPVDWPTTREVFARRNLIVHNGGAINRIYLSLTSKGKGNPSDIKVGTLLRVDSDYFSTAVQNLLALGLILVTDVGRKLGKTYADRLNSSLLFHADLALKRNAWHTSLAISKYLLTSRLSRKDNLKAQSINWAARKHICGIDDIRAEVTGWDIGGLSEEYSHYKAVLLGDKQKAIDEVERLLANGKLLSVEVALNPIYAEILDAIPSLSSADAQPSSHPAEANELPKNQTAAKKATARKQPTKKATAKEAAKKVTAKKPARRPRSD